MTTFSGLFLPILKGRPHKRKNLNTLYVQEQRISRDKLNKLRVFGNKSILQYLGSFKK